MCPRTISDQRQKEDHQGGLLDYLTHNRFVHERDVVAFDKQNRDDARLLVPRELLRLAAQLVPDPFRKSLVVRLEAGEEHAGWAIARLSDVERERDAGDGIKHVLPVL